MWNYQDPMSPLKKKGTQILFELLTYTIRTIDLYILYITVSWAYDFGSEAGSSFYCFFLSDVSTSQSIVQRLLWASIQSATWDTDSWHPGAEPMESGNSPIKKKSWYYNNIISPLLSTL